MNENKDLDTTKRPEPEPPHIGGEDDGSTEVEGDDSHLHDDQKTKPLST